MIDPLDPRSYPRRFFSPINHEINFNPLYPSFIFSYLKESFFIAMDPNYRYYIAKFYFFQLFKGIFFYCDGPQLQRLQIKNKDDCLTHSGSGHKWVNHKYNFDNLGKDINPKYYKNSNKFFAFLFSDRLSRQGSTGNSEIMLVYPTFEGNFFIFLWVEWTQN